jgi:hypothetical protein
MLHKLLRVLRFIGVSRPQDTKYSIVPVAKEPNQGPHHSDKFFFIDI